MRFDLDESIAILERTPATVDRLLRGLPAAWTTPNEGPDTWSALDVVGHLIHGEEDDWIPRARMILEHGESRTFKPFDRFAMFERFGGASLEDLLDRFAEIRTESLVTLRAWNLKPEQLALRGRHPSLGVVTLEHLLACWVVHDLSHLAQIARVMAKQYHEAVGPWVEYHPILTRR